MIQQWLQQIKQRLSDIEADYEQATPNDRCRLREEFHQLHQEVHDLLEGWILLEEHVASILKIHPDLAEEEEELGEEFYLDRQAVRSFRQGQGYYQLQMFTEARPYFRDVVEKEPEFLLGRLYLALSDFQQGKWMDAYRQFQLVAATSDSPRFSAFAHHMLGCIHVQRNQDELAIKQFERCLSTDEESGDGDTWFNLGACYFRLERYHEAIPLFFHALRHDEEDWESMYYLSVCYEQAGHRESVLYWRMAAYQKARHPAVMEAIARHFEQMGDTGQAILWYGKLVTAEPKKAKGYHGLSWNLWLQGRKEEAYAVLQKGLTLEPKHEDLLFTYVWYLLQSGDEKQVQKALIRLPQHLAEHPLWLVLQSRLSLNLEDYDHAEAVARQVIDSPDPLNRSLGYYQLGRVHLARQRPALAIDSFRKARELSPRWEEPIFYEGLCHLLNGQTDRTRQCWENLPLEKKHSVL